MVTLPGWAATTAKPAPAYDADRSLDEIRNLLSAINPDCGYDDWCKAMMAVHCETGGSMSGFALVDNWSAGGSKYPGSRELETKWKSFSGSAITGATLAEIARQHGADLSDIAKRNKSQSQQSQIKAESKPVELPEINAASFAGKDVPERRFHDTKGLIPFQGVTLLYGDGGTGKSLLALQLAAATVTDKQWLGTNVRRGPVYYFSAEDPIDEVHIRLNAINTFLGSEMSALEGLNIAPMVGQECVLGADNGKGIIQPTAVYHAFMKRAKAIKPAIVIIDNAIDVYAGDQNAGPQVKQFMHLLSGLSMECNCPVVLLSHPSKSGMASGVGDGGSVHWSNSARSRLYLSRVYSDTGENLLFEDDPCARILSVKKANYAATGQEIRMRWEEGCFVHDQADRVESGDEMGAAHKAERVFLHLLELFERQGRHVSANPSSAYAPSQFARHNQCEGVSKRRLEQAMNVLFNHRRIEVQEHGSPSNRRRHIPIVEDNS